MTFTIHEYPKSSLYTDHSFDYVINDNGIHYGVDREEYGYALYLLDEDGFVSSDGRDTRNWGAFYQLGWTKDEMHEGIKKEWAPHLLPPYANLEPALIERYGEEYEGERIDEMFGDAQDDLYKETFIVQDKNGFIEPAAEKDEHLIYTLIYNGQPIEANNTFELADKLMGMQKFGSYPIIQEGTPLFENDEEPFSPWEYWDGSILFDDEYPKQIDNERLLEYAAFSLDCNVNDLELKTEKEKPMMENTGNMKLEEQQFNSLEELDQWAGDNPQAAKRTTFAHVKIPCAFVTPYTYTAKDGREYDKAFVSIPKGTSINGIDVGGYSCSVFMNDRMTQQHLDGEHVTLGFKSNEAISIWTGKKDSEQYPYKQFEVNPWDFVKAIKQQLDNYKEEKNQERAEAKKSHPSSLSSMAKGARNASNALSQKNQDHLIVDPQTK